jgi:NAD-dependent SIR2 family protein deacetylase
MMNDVDDEGIARAAEVIAGADALLIGAGAGMGVDSGLPDFRGDEGFWNNYPPFEKRGLDFYDLANPRWFHEEPRLAWGFYGHRLHLYRDTDPHAGHGMLRDWGRGMSGEAFVFTSNVDGQFQKAGFPDDKILECHGTIHHLQCADGCRHTVWPADGVDVEVDEETFHAVGELPTCRYCDGIARPNVLMFGDFGWVGQRTEQQKSRFRDWMSSLDPSTSLAVVECGAGTAVPTVRSRCEQVADRYDGTLIRINPRESQAPPDAISLAGGALDVLSAVQTYIE